jgi:hypothetical protein
LSFNDTGYGLAGSLSNSEKLARTPDWGIEWEEAALPNAGSVHSISYFQERFWLLLNDQIYQSEDWGDHWKIEASALNDLTHLSLTIQSAGAFGWAVGRQGTILHAMPRSMNIELPPDNAEPHGFVLLQNYPNPFNPATTIAFRLSKSEKTNIQIFDINGHLIRRINRGFLQPGSYEVVWDGKDENGDRASSGIYTCELRAGTERDVRKMLLIK